jgi:hypothetical protein
MLSSAAPKSPRLCASSWALCASPRFRSACVIDSTPGRLLAIAACKASNAIDVPSTTAPIAPAAFNPVSALVLRADEPVN